MALGLFGLALLEHVQQLLDVRRFGLADLLEASRLLIEPFAQFLGQLGVPIEIAVFSQERPIKGVEMPLVVDHRGPGDVVETAHRVLVRTGPQRGRQVQGLRRSDRHIGLPQPVQQPQVEHQNRRRPLT